MKKRIFRQAALDRLSSGDRLDQAQVIVFGRTWFAIATLVFGVVMLAGWAVRASAPVKISAGGIVLQEAGLKEIFVLKGGRIISIDVAVGDTVEAEQVVATFQRDSKAREANLVEQEADDIRARLALLQKFYASENQREDDRRKSQVASINKSIELTSRRLELLRERGANFSQLVAQKVVTKTNLIENQLKVAESTEKLAGLQNEVRAIDSKVADRRREQRLRMLDDELKLSQLERQMKRLKTELAEQSVLKSPHSGEVAEIRAGNGDVVETRQSIMTLSPINADEQKNVAIVYIAAEYGRQVRPGMKAELVPSAYKRARYGFVRSEVVSVSPITATRAGMLQVLRNESLVNDLANGSSVFEVKVRMQQDPSTPSGLAWSSSQGPPAQVFPGTLIKAQIVIEHKAVANLVFPGLSKHLGL